MNIRIRLTVLFFAIVTILLVVVSFGVYFLSENYQSRDFYRRLRHLGTSVAQGLLDVNEVDVDFLDQLETKGLAMLPNQNVVIFNDKEEMIYATNNVPAISVDADLLKKIKAEKEVRFSKQSFKVIGFLITADDRQSTIVVAATDVHGTESLRHLQKILLITFCISTVCLTILGWLYAGSILAPINSIIHQMSTISEENLSLRLDEGKKSSETDRLAITCNNMLRRLQSAFLSQKNFIANASHEIKTPITIMSSQIEVSLFQDHDKDHYKAVLRSVLEHLQGLNSLSTQLLLLAQTSTDSPHTKLSALRIDDVLWEMKDELLKASPDYLVDIHFNFNPTSELLLIEGDEQLIKVAMLNLLDNGCKYSDDHRVHVLLDFKPGNRLLITFRNNGPGFTPDQINKIFAPFYRANADKKVKGHGIGLSLVYRIVELHRGTIHVDSIPGQSTQFTIAFPIYTSKQNHRG